MTHDRTTILIEAWIDGTIDDVELAELEVALLESLAVRRAFWVRALFHGALHEAAKIEFAASSAPDGGAPPARPLAPWPRAGRRDWLLRGITVGMALLVVGGCGIGSAVTSLAFAYSGLLSRPQPKVIVHEEGFERPPTPEQRYIPDRLGIWGGDETVVVGAEHGIAPRSGARMLRFLSPCPRGAVCTGQASEIWRIIDLDLLRAAADSRNVRIDFSACFNGCQTTGEPRSCMISATATDKHPRELGRDWTEQFKAAEENPHAVATTQAREHIDANPATWQRLSVSVTAPEGARFLILHCLTSYRPDEDGNVAERCGQYADDIDVVVSAAQPANVATAGHRQEGRR